MRKIEKIHAPWSAPSFVELSQPDPAFPSSVGVALNLDGSIAAGSGPVGDDAFLKGLLWTDPSSTPAIGDPGPGLFDEYTDLTSMFGSVVGNRTSLTTFENHPFIKGPAFFANLPLVPGYVSEVPTPSIARAPSSSARPRPTPVWATAASRPSR